MTTQSKSDIKPAERGAQRHPTKVAVFSAEDIPEGLSPEWSMLPLKPAVQVNGVVMEMWVSVIVPKGMVYVIDKGE